MSEVVVRKDAWKQRRASIEEFFCNRIDEQERHVQPRWWGRSSDALILYAIAERWPAWRYFPSDPDDLASCWLTWCRLPEQYAAAGAEAYAAFREHVEQRYPKAAMYPADECWQTATQLAAEPA